MQTVQPKGYQDNPNIDEGGEPTNGGISRAKNNSFNQRRQGHVDVPKCIRNVRSGTRGL